MSAPTFKGTAVVTVTIEMEISGETGTGEIDKLRDAMAMHAGSAVGKCLEGMPSPGSWRRQVGAVRATAVKLDIEWEL